MGVRSLCSNNKQTDVDWDHCSVNSILCFCLTFSLSISFQSFYIWIADLLYINDILPFLNSSLVIPMNCQISCKIEWLTVYLMEWISRSPKILSIQRLQRPPSPDTHILIHCSLVLCEAWVKQTVTVRPTDKPTSHYYQHTFTNKQRVHREVSTALDCLKMSNLL